MGLVKMPDGIVQLAYHTGGNGEEAKKTLVMCEEDQINSQDLQLLTARIKDKGMPAKQSRIRHIPLGDWQTT